MTPIVHVGPEVALESSELVNGDEVFLIGDPFLALDENHISDSEERSAVEEVISSFANRLQTSRNRLLPEFAKCYRRHCHRTLGHRRQGGVEIDPGLAKVPHNDIVVSWFQISNPMAIYPRPSIGPPGAKSLTGSVAPNGVATCCAGYGLLWRRCESLGVRRFTWMVASFPANWRQGTLTLVGKKPGWISPCLTPSCSRLTRIVQFRRPSSAGSCFQHPYQPVPRVASFWSSSRQIKRPGDEKGSLPWI